MGTEDGLILDDSCQVLLLKRLRLPLTWTEWAFVRILMSNANRIAYCTELYVGMWGQLQPKNPSNTLRVTVRRLRNKIAEKNFPIAIETSYGRGFREGGYWLHVYDHGGTERRRCIGPVLRRGSDASRFANTQRSNLGHHDKT